MYFDVKNRQFFHLGQIVRDVMEDKKVSSKRELAERLDKLSDKSPGEPEAKSTEVRVYALLNKEKEMRQQDLMKLSMALKHNFYVDLAVFMTEEMISQENRKRLGLTLSPESLDAIRQKLQAIRKLDREIEAIIDPDASKGVRKKETMTDLTQEELEDEFIKKYRDLARFSKRRV